MDSCEENLHAHCVFGIFLQGLGKQQVGCLCEYHPQCDINVSKNIVFSKPLLSVYIYLFHNFSCIAHLNFEFFFRIMPVIYVSHVFL